MSNIQQKKMTGWKLVAFLLMGVPTLAVCVKMWWFPDNSWSGAAFLAAKLSVLFGAFFLAPKLYLTRGFPRISKKGMMAANIFGVITCAAIIGAWYGWGKQHLGGEGIKHFRGVIASFNMDVLWRYLLAAVAYCFVNSLLEEYFWRWFCVKGIFASKGIVGILLVNAIFGVHHYLAVAKQTEGYGVEIAVLAAVGVLVGGCAWSWIYYKSQNIWAAWVAHIWGDIGVFYIGYVIVFN